MSKNILVPVISWLSSVVEDYPVSNLIPKNLPDKFITVERTSSYRDSMVMEKANIVIDIYNKKSAYDCATLADSISDALPTILNTEDDITHAEVISCYELNDTKRGYFRNEIACLIFYRH